MRAWLLHGVFAIILIGSLAKGRASDVPTEAGSLEPAVIRLAQSHGLSFHQDSTPSEAGVRTLVFEAPGCARPVSVALLLVTLEQEPVVRATRGRRDGLRYFYLDRTWTTPDRLAVFVERKKHRALAIFGLTRYVASAEMLLVDAPPGCRIAEAIDWRVVWDRDYLTAARAEARPRL